jgi:hypothetical protein
MARRPVLRQEACQWPNGEYLSRNNSSITILFWHFKVFREKEF